MPAPVTTVSAGGKAHLNRLHNNTASWWFRDPALRKLAYAIFIGWSGLIAGGFDGSLIAGLLANPLYLADLELTDSNKLGLIVASAVFGGIAAILPAAWISDRFGRRITLGVGAIIIIIGAIVQALTSGGWNMLAGRLIVGLGSFCNTIATGPYVAEVAHPRFRAEATSLITVCFYVGSIIAAWTTYGVLSIPGDWSWRLPCMLQVVPSGWVLVSLPFIPESPRWLLSKGRDADARRMLVKYHANGDENDELVNYEFEEIKEALAEEKRVTSGVSYMTFFKTKGNRHRILLVSLVAFFAQMVGNGIISYYLTDILKSVGITDAKAQTEFNGGLQIWNLIVAALAGTFCERFPRRVLWLTSAIGMLSCFVIVTACSAVYANTGSVAAGNTVLAFVFIYFGFYDIAFTALSQTYVAEILPFSLRAKGFAIFTFWTCISAIISLYVNPIALAAIAWKYYLLFICINAVAIVSIYFLFPETRGLVLEEVAEIFDGPEAALPIAVAGAAADAEKLEKEMVEQIEDKE